MNKKFKKNEINKIVSFMQKDKKNQNGKLRLLYECNPMSYIIEQAGGESSNGSKRILEIITEKLHQRNSFMIGSKQDVQDAKKFHEN